MCTHTAGLESGIAAHDGLDCQFSLFASEGDGNSVNLENVFWHMSSAVRLCNCILNGRDLVRGELLPFLQSDEQQDPFVCVLTGATLPYTDGVVDKVELFDNVVNLCRPKSHPAWVQHAVTASDDFVSSRRRVAKDEISLCPHLSGPQVQSVQW